MNTTNKQPDRRTFLAGLAGLMMSTTALSPTPVLAASAAVERRVHRVANRVLAIARAGGSASAFRNLMLRNAAVSSAALFALGKYKRRLPKAKRRAYVNMYANYIARLFARHHKRLAGNQFVITGTKGVFVKGAIIHASGQRTPVEWRMAGSRIFDVKIQGIWLGLHVRSEFVRVLNQTSGNFDALLRHMQKG